MTQDESKSLEQQGWEKLYRHDLYPPRYRTQADPNASVVEWADALPQGASVLDVGCGAGRHVLYLGQRGLQMSGVDLSPLGIQLTKTACDERQMPFDGRVADILALPWASDTFDGALSTSVICHYRWANMLEAMDEVWRVLKPNGTFLVDFSHRQTASYHHTLAQVQEGRMVEIEPNTFINPNPDPQEMDDDFLPYHFPDEAEVHELVKRFDIVKIWETFLGQTEGQLPARGYWVAWLKKPLA